MLICVLAAFQGGCSKSISVGPENAEYLATAAEVDCGYIQNEFGQRVSWKTHAPIEFFVSKSIPAEFHADLQEAADAWNKAAGKTVIIINLTKLDTTEFSTPDLVNSITGFKEWDETKATQQAITIVKYRSALIFEADIKVNFKDFVYYSKESQSTTQIHFGSLLVHEFGHALGLKHGIVKPTVMWATLASIFVRTQLSGTDTSSLECEYK